MTDDVNVEKSSNEEKPEGADFFVPLPDGFKVWFRDLKQSQRLMLSRAYDASAAARIRIHEGSGTDEEKGKALSELARKNDKRLWDAIDSAVLNPAHIDLIMDAMIAATIDQEWAWKVIRGGAPAPVIPDDDAEEVAPSKPARRAKASANVQRTQVK